VVACAEEEPDREEDPAGGAESWKRAVGHSQPFVDVESNLCRAVPGVVGRGADSTSSARVDLRVDPVASAGDASGVEINLQVDACGARRE
jgi:hypothetical protein